MGVKADEEGGHAFSFDINVAGYRPEELKGGTDIEGNSIVVEGYYFLSLFSISLHFMFMHRLLFYIFLCYTDLYPEVYPGFSGGDRQNENFLENFFNL